MKALRRSIKGEKETKQPHISIGPKSAVAIVPPKKVIRALYDYEAQNDQELSFSRGDFFHVIGRENDQDWYEACNPAQAHMRGLVPVGFFQSLGRTQRDSGSSQPDMARSLSSIKSPDHDSGYGENSTAAVTTPPASICQRSSKTMGGSGGAMIYGIVMYDFKAERADELEAKAGEAIIVIAQSNPEWFVAKPIGKLGGPGLIPVSFVEIRDMASNVPVPNPQEAIRRAGIPRVEEWKKMAADYKNSSITLGKFEGGGGGGQQQQQSYGQNMGKMSLQQGEPNTQNGGAVQQPKLNQQPIQQPSKTYSDCYSRLYAPISAHIPRYCFSEDRYWFVVVVTLEDCRTWELLRYYEDFYDFQIALLTEFPEEAGNSGNHKRTLPYMPGPVNYVTDAITEGRQLNLDAYVKSLLAQPRKISRCNLVKQFFTPRVGDYEVDGDGNSRDNYRFSGGSQPSSTSSPDGSRQNSNGNGAYSAGLSAPRQQPLMHRQVSSLSQPSQSLLSPAIAGGGSGQAVMKVKLNHHDEKIAIMVPHDIQFRDLYKRIVDRLKITPGEQIQLFYRDEATEDKVSMVSNNDLDIALSRNEKLVLYVE